MSTKSAEIAALENESIGKLLFRYSLPAIASMVVFSLYNIVDSIFIGRWVGVLALSAMAVTFPIMNLTFAFGMLAGIGGAAICSIRIGEKDMNGALLVLGHEVLLSIILGSCFALVSIPILDPALMAFGASTETLEYAHDFMVIILAALPCTYTFFNLSHIMRASGYPYKAMFASVVTVGFNIVLAPISLLVLKWGISGAACATVISQIMGLIYVLYHFCKSKNLLHFRKGIFVLRMDIVAGILSIGLAPFLINICICAIVAVINIGLYKYSGDLAIGAYGIINRVLVLVVMIVMGLAQGMQPIAGYNYGAKQISRVKQTLKYGLIWGTVITTIGCAVSQFFPELIAAMFTKENNPELIALSVNGLRLTTLFFPLVGGQIILINFFQSIGRAKVAIFLSLTRQLIFLLPALLICPHFWGLNGIWLSLPISDLLSVLIAVLVFALFLHEVRHQNQ